MEGKEIAFERRRVGRKIPDESWVTRDREKVVALDEAEFGDSVGDVEDVAAFRNAEFVVEDFASLDLAEHLEGRKRTVEAVLACLEVGASVRERAQRGTASRIG